MVVSLHMVDDTINELIYIKLMLLDNVSKYRDLNDECWWCMVNFVTIRGPQVKNRVFLRPVYK